MESYRGQEVILGKIGIRTMTILRQMKRMRTSAPPSKMQFSSIRQVLQGLILGPHLQGLQDRYKKIAGRHFYLKYSVD